MWLCDHCFFQNQIIFISGSDLKTCIAKYSHHLGSSSSYVNAFNIKSCSFQSLWKWLVRISELGTPKRPWGGCWKVQPFQEPMHWGYQAYFLGLCFTESDPSDLPSNISLICILYIYIYVCKGFNDHDQGMIIPLIYGTVPLSLHLMVTQWLNVFFLKNQFPFSLADLHYELMVFDGYTMIKCYDPVIRREQTSVFGIHIPNKYSLFNGEPR